MSVNKMKEIKNCIHFSSLSKSTLNPQKLNDQRYVQTKAVYKDYVTTF